MIPARFFVRDRETEDERVADRFDSMEHREDRPVASAVFTDSNALASAAVTVRDAALRTVHSLYGVAASVHAGADGPYAYFQFGPSRLGFSNRTETYGVEFKVTDSSGFLFASIVDVKVRQAGE